MVYRNGKGHQIAHPSIRTLLDVSSPTFTGKFATSLSTYHRQPKAPWMILLLEYIGKWHKQQVCISLILSLQRRREQIRLEFVLTPCPLVPTASLICEMSVAENGSGGFMSELSFIGGSFGLRE